MSKDGHWIAASNKRGLHSTESYIVGRKDQVFLRILGRDPYWEIMTATASEDNGQIKVYPDRARLIETAYKIGHRRETSPFSKLDLRNREYVLICTLEREEGETDEVLNRDLKQFSDEFFATLDEDRDANRARDEMIEIYRSLSDEDFGADIYLSDGVWLSSDGSVEDRGR